MAVDDNDLPIGAALKKAREVLGLEQKAVAMQLNLPVDRIAEIENSDYKTSISSAFYRGYIRSFSEVVDIDLSSQLDNVSHEADAYLKQESEDNQLLPSYNKNKEMNTKSYSFRWFTLLLIFILILVIGAAIQQDLLEMRLSEHLSYDDTVSSLMDSDRISDSETEADDTLNNNETILEAEKTLKNEDRLSTEVTKDSHAADLKESHTLEKQTVSISKAMKDRETEGFEKEGSENKLTELEQKQEAMISQKTEKTLQAGEVLQTDKTLQTGETADLQLVFIDECWIQVHDATGKRLAIGLKKTDRIVSINGQPPFDVILGNPTAVRLKINEQSVDLSGYRAGRRASFKVTTGATLLPL